jgi:uncharacterized protein (DUF1697 family)
VAESAILKRFGLQVPVVVRSAEELSAAAEANPFLEKRAKAVDVDRLHVAFLAREPERKRVEALDPRRSPPDEFIVRGRDIYLHLPHGVAKTKLTNAYFDSKLATVSTMRNWRTVLKMVDLTQA